MKMLILIDETTTEDGRDVAFRRWVPFVETLRTDEFEVSLATLRGRFDAGDTALRQPAFTLSSPSNVGLPVAILRLRRILRQHDFDVVQGHEVLPALVAGLAARPTSTVSIFFRHHLAGSRKLRAATRFATAATEATFGPSEAVARAARELDGRDPGRVRAVLNGVYDMAAPRTLVDGLRDELGIRTGDHVVAAITRLRAEKGIEVLIEALERVAEKLVGKLHLVVVGSGPHEGRLRNAASRCAFTTHFVGHQSEVAPWYSLADVVVIPSLRESFGLSAAEAMAASRPVVASDVGGLREQVVPGTTGTLVPAGNPAAFAEAIISLLTDRDLCRRFGTAGRARYEQLFTIEAQAERWRAAVADLLARPR